MADNQAPQPLPHWLAIALVCGTSGAVLVLEIMAGRVMAPYVGVNLETFTAIIGTILAGIALGARVGGTLADQRNPRQLIPLLLVVGGALAILSVPVVRLLGGTAGPSSPGIPAVLLAAVGFLPSAAVLSAIPPAVVKLQLRDLAETGDVVGRLSAWGTGGAIVGTFLAGYVLVAFAAVTTLIIGVGGALIASGLALWLANRPSAPTSAAAMSLVAVSVGSFAAVGSGCDEQTAYYCVSIERDDDRPSGRALILDDLRHSYVDTADPTHLEFWYVRQIAHAIDHLATDGPINVVSLGAGAMTMPRYIAATRPGSTQTVLELDRQLIEVVEREFGAVDGADIVTGDGRLAVRSVPTASADVFIGDAFGGRAVPWHLATVEFTREVARVLRPGGIYTVNVIDGPSQAFLRAAAATIREVLPHVSVMLGDGLSGGGTGNAVIVASDEPFDADAWNAARLAADEPGTIVADIDGYVDGAVVLTDEFAPVDQLISGAR